MQHFHSPTSNIVELNMLWELNSVQRHQYHSPPSNIIPQGNQTCVRCWIQQCWTLLNGKVASFVRGLTTRTPNLIVWFNNIIPYFAVGSVMAQIHRLALKALVNFCIKVNLPGSISYEFRLNSLHSTYVWGGRMHSRRKWNANVTRHQS